MTTNTSINQPLFIVGVGRSGTTLLRLMLNKHTSIAIPYETHFITNYVDIDVDERSVNEVIDKLLSENMTSKWDYVPTREEAISELKENTAAGAIDAVFSAYATKCNKKRWGDKSDYLDRMHLINDLFPTAKFIHIIRDGRDVASSVIKLPWGPNDLVAAAEWWSLHVHQAQVMGHILGSERYTEVRYEDLVNRPESELQRLCAFFGEQFEPEMLDYHDNSGEQIPEERRKQHYNLDKPLEKSRTFAWKKEMYKVNVAVFEDFAYKTLQASGYSVGSEKISFFRKEVQKLYSYVRRHFCTTRFAKKLRFQR